MSETMKFPARRSSGRAPEKSNFAQTCSLLSQYLKEKGSIGDLSREMSGILETKGRSETIRPTTVTTMNLLTSMDRPALNFSTHFAGNCSSDPVEDTVRKPDLGRSGTTIEPEAAQMTIFYAGEVMVYDDFPADKAREIMGFASKGRSSQIPNTHSVYTPNTAKIALNHPSSSSVTPNMDHPSSSSVTPNMDHPSSSVTPNMDHPTTDSLSNVAIADKECLPKPTPPVGPADMPITRRKSLHRFLEKRKDRSTTRAPYPAINKLVPAPEKPDESNPVAEMETQPSELLELKL